MKVRITTTVEIDPQAWALDYGITPEEVREDVKVWAENLLNTQLEVMGMRPETV